MPRYSLREAMSKKRGKKAPKTGGLTSARQQAAKTAGTVTKSSSTRNRQPKGSKSGGQFATGSQAVDISVEDLELVREKFAEQSYSNGEAPKSSTGKRSSGRRGQLPSREDFLDYLFVHDVSRNRLADHFKVPAASITRMIDELNEDFIQAGPSERIVCSKKGRKVMWWYTTDANEITSYVRNHGRIGRDFDVYIEEVYSDGGPVILNMELVRRDLSPPHSVSHMQKATERFVDPGDRGGEVPARWAVIEQIMAQNLQHPAHDK